MGGGLGDGESKRTFTGYAPTLVGERMLKQNSIKGLKSKHSLRITWTRLFQQSVRFIIPLETIPGMFSFYYLDIISGITSKITGITSKNENIV